VMNQEIEVETEIDLWDLEQLRIPFSDLFLCKFHRKPLPRHRFGEPFLLGPIPFLWVSQASQLPGIGLQVTLILRFLRDRFRHGRDRRWTLKTISTSLRVSLNSVRRGLYAAEEAGLLSVAHKSGRKIIAADVTILSLPGESTHRPLRGPIPLTWLLPALHLEGSALRVALACWLQAGWERSAEIELNLSDWRELKLSPQSASRGLKELEQATLVSVVRQPGQSVKVTILDQPSATAPNIIRLLFNSDQPCPN
jgi:hypothetical protein